MEAGVESCRLAVGRGMAAVLVLTIVVGEGDAQRPAQLGEKIELFSSVRSDT